MPGLYIPAAMDAQGIPFTQHWGKTNGYTPARVQTMFGPDYNAWIAARHTLLPDPADGAAVQGRSPLRPRLVRLCVVPAFALLWLL